MPRKRAKKKKQSIKRKIGGIFFVCLMAGTAYFLFGSSILQIKKIKIVAPDFISKEAIQKIIQNNLDQNFFWLFPKKNIIFFSTNNVVADILNFSPEIESVSVNKKALNLLEVNITSRQNVGVWCKTAKHQIEADEDIIDNATTSDKLFKQEEITVERCFNIDKNGVIFKESPLISSNLILLIYDSTYQSTSEIKSNVASPETIQFILTSKQWLANDLNIKIDNFEIISETDLKAKTSEGWQIYFSSLNSVESQLNSLKTVLTELIKNDRLSLEYVDLRIDGRVYYK